MVQQSPTADTAVQIIDRVKSGWKWGAAFAALVVAFGGVVYGVAQATTELDWRVRNNTAKIDKMAPQVEGHGLALERIETTTDLMWEVMQRREARSEQ